MENIFHHIINSFFLLTCLQVVKSLRISEFIVPRNAFEGSDARIICSYDLEGYPLYTLKWYRNEEEFFRYEPKAKEPYMYLPVKGIKINRSNSTHILLSNVNKFTEGSFACEVSTDIQFQTLHQESHLTIVASRSSDNLSTYSSRNVITVLLLLQLMVSHQIIKSHFSVNLNVGNS
uniref:Ig-like domain-containing protein n=1 Tax=Tetranychus urticae TaxID=32264 RepID=T1K077_TETUR